MTATTVKETLINIKSLLKTTGWCQGTYARDKWGNKCFPRSPEASSFCLSGAYDVVGGDPEKLAWRLLSKMVENIYPYYSIANWNDKQGRTREEVLALLDQAIENAEQLLPAIEVL